MTQYNTMLQQVKIYDEISDVRSIAPRLWQVDRCFAPDTLQRLQTMYHTEGNEFVVGGLKKRLQLKFGSADFDFIHNIGSSMTESMSDLLQEPLRFVESKYWLDLPQFGCQSHADAEDLLCSFQVYLESSNRLVPDYTTTTVTHYQLLAEGAVFTHVEPPCQIDFSPNTGYINDNRDLKPHWVPGRWDTRISVMFQYSRV